MLNKLRKLRNIIAGENKLDSIIARNQLIDMLDDIIKDAEVETIKGYEDKAANLIRENL